MVFVGGRRHFIYLTTRHDVLIVDNLSRRCIDVEMEVQSLTPIQPMGVRLKAWNEVSGRSIEYVNLDVAREYDRLCDVLVDYQPDAVVHFAEQRAAPYSMRSPKAKRYTLDNNVTGTHNLLCGLVATGVDANIVHLGTMGVYGYGWSGTAPIPEGYLTVKVPTPDGDVERNILHPANPGSVYHLTKTLDQLMFAFYTANDGLRITDLHQGIVWGTQTSQTALDERLINRFDYDGDYGTEADPVPHAGRHRASADGARDRRPEACVHPHPRHGALHRTGAPPRASKLVSDPLCVQSGHHRDLQRDGPGKPGQRSHQLRDRPPAEPTQRSGRQRPHGHQREGSWGWVSKSPRFPMVCSKSAPKSPLGTDIAWTPPRLWPDRCGGQGWRLPPT